MIRKAIGGVALVLVVFHGWLFGSQAWDGQLTDLSLVIRWLIAGGLVLGLRSLRRRGAPMFWGRRAVALWLLAAVLHGPALAERVGVTMDGPALPEIVATLAQVSATAAVAAGLLMLLALLLGARRRAPRSIARGLALDSVVFVAQPPGFHSAFAPRPPPLA
jgi:hypothetical protein